MNLPSKYLEDAEGNKCAPITTPNAIRWPDGSNLNDHISMTVSNGTLYLTPVVTP